MRERIRVFLIDDHTVVRQGLRLLIDAEPDLLVVGESGHGRDAAAEIRAIGGADVVVLDISMPDTSGPYVANELREALPSAKIVALSRHMENAYVQRMLQCGALGYVFKQAPAKTLVAAIRAAYAGQHFLDPAITERTVDFPQRTDSGRAPIGLTNREREVIALVANGHTNKEIAAILGITVKTVETHKGNAMQKLGITSRVGLVRFALEQGWLDRQ